jgi:hypothetical protein
MLSSLPGGVHFVIVSVDYSEHNQVLVEKLGKSVSPTLIALKLVRTRSFTKEPKMRFTGLNNFGGLGKRRWQLLSAAYSSKCKHRKLGRNEPRTKPMIRNACKESSHAAAGILSGKNEPQSMRGKPA